jgi:NADH-quinone oxidoreductase subunit A
MYQEDYLILLVHFVICLLISCLLVLVTYLVAPRNPGVEKLSSYECGFQPFGDARIKFDVHFYLVAILFIIFDLEVVLIFPWCATSVIMNNIRFWTMMSFIVILTIGFIYEWTKGALMWK